MAAHTSPVERGGPPAVAGGEAAGGEAAGGSGPLAAVKRWHASMQASSSVYALLAEVVQAIREDQPGLLAKQAAYSLLYAVPSGLIVLISLAAIVDKNTGYGVSEALQGFIAEQAPANVQPLLASLVQYALVETSENTAIVAAIISLAIALWSASGGVGALIYAVNDVYDIRDTRSFVVQAAIRVGLMLVGGVLVVASLLFLAFGRLLLRWLPGEFLEESPLAGLLGASPLWALGLLFLALLALYGFGLDTPKSPRWLLPGALLATLAVGLLMALLDLILTYSNPGAAFGVAGSVLILLWTLFMLSQIVIIGAIINAVLGRRYDRTLISGLQARPFELPSGKEIAISNYR